MWKLCVLALVAGSLAPVAVAQEKKAEEKH